MRFPAFLLFKTERMYAQLAEQVATQLAVSRREWAGFLTTAARLYKYPFHEQMMIYAQRPDSAACVEYDLWNEKMGRYVRRGAKGIALVDDSGDRPRLRYVFDISDTGAREHSGTPWLWKMEDRHMGRVTAMLESTYDVIGDNLAQQLTDVAGKLAEEYWTENRQDFFYIVDGSLPQQLSGRLEQRSAKLTSRCCGKSVLLSEMRSAKPCKRGATTVNNPMNYIQNGDYLIPDLKSERTEKPLGKYGRMRKAYLKERRPILYNQLLMREAVSASERDRRDNHETNGTADASAGRESRSNGEAESRRFDEVGRSDEHLQSSGRGNPDDGTYQQLTLNLFLSENEQIRNIDEAESAAHTFSAFFDQETGAEAPKNLNEPLKTRSQNEIDDAFRIWNDNEDSKHAVVRYMADRARERDAAAWLAHKYDSSNGKGMLAFNAANSVKVELSWPKVQRRVAQLIQENHFLTEAEQLSVEKNTEEHFAHTPAENI